MPIAPRLRSGYFERALAANFLVLNGFESGVNTPCSKVKSSHCSMVLVISVFMARSGYVAAPATPDEATRQITVLPLRLRSKLCPPSLRCL
jgi:hypothetical protein